MSHLPERKEKSCLNCGAAVYGRFCHVCGQENIEPKENFWHLLTHFIYDITHFDGKFFNSLKYLLFRPGYLSHEYLKGRRASYLHPIRMYVFTSAFFFLIYFSFYQKEAVVNITNSPATAVSLMAKLQKNKAATEEQLKNTAIPAIAQNRLRQSLAMIDSDIALLQSDTAAKGRLRSFNRDITLLPFSEGAVQYQTIGAYDAAQQSLPASKRDNFFLRKLKRQYLHLKEQYHNDSKAILSAVIEELRHLFPKLLFVSLPLFALVLQLLYIRRRQFYYVNHCVYTIHLYCATFIIMLLGMGASSLPGQLGEWMANLFTLLCFAYWYKGIRNFYGQSRGKTILKYILVLFLMFVMLVILVSVFFLFSAFAI